MTTDEINSAISKYMGESSIVGAEWVTNWVASLDHLIPVWVKCTGNATNLAVITLEIIRAGIIDEVEIKKAAAEVTAGAIQELK